jgi:hypothetical protein
MREVVVGIARAADDAGGLGGVENNVVKAYVGGEQG